VGAVRCQSSMFLAWVHRSTASTNGRGQTTDFSLVVMLRWCQMVRLLAGPNHLPVDGAHAHGAEACEKSATGTGGCPPVSPPCACVVSSQATDGYRTTPRGLISRCRAGQPGLRHRTGCQAATVGTGVRVVCRRGCCHRHPGPTICHELCEGKGSDCHTAVMIDTAHSSR
jgi:hypothetical protein